MEMSKVWLPSTTRVELVHIMLNKKWCKNCINMISLIQSGKHTKLNCFV